MKKCTKCGEQKPLSEFHKSSKLKSGLYSYCKSCTKNIELERVQYKKEYYLVKAYGITVEQEQILKDSQHGKCKICQKQLELGKKSHIDHCHISGKIRGILCHNCNAGLGHFKDNIQALTAAIEYLSHSGVKNVTKA